MKIKKIIAAAIATVTAWTYISFYSSQTEFQRTTFTAHAEENVDNYGWTKLDMGVDYDVTAISKNSIKVENTSKTPEAWWQQAMYEGISLASGKTYELSFTLSADREAYMHTAIQECPEPYNVYSLNKYLATEEKTTYSQIFTMPDDCENTKISFCFGYGEGTFYIDDIQLNEVGENLVYPSKTWNNYVTDGASAEFDIPLSEYSINSNVSKEGKYSWSIGMNTNNFTLNNGRKYLVCFDAKGTSGNILCTSVQRTDGKYCADKEDQYYYAAVNDYFELSDEFRHYSYTIDVTEDTFSNWYLGFNPTQGIGEFTIENVVVCDIGTSDSSPLPSKYTYTTEQITCNNGDKEIFGICYKPDTNEWNCQEMCSQRITKILDRQESSGVMSQPC